LAVVNDELEQYRSANGMRVVLEHRADAGLAGATLVIGAGTSDEDAPRAGLAHLTEHLILDAHPDGLPSLQARLEALGAAAHNGMTTWDATRYFVFAPQQTLQDLLFALAGVLRDPLVGVDDADLAAERQIVKNEARFRSDDGSPGQAIGWLMEASFPPQHPYARSGTGKTDTLDRITLGDVRAFASKHYVPGGATLIVQSPLPIGAQRALVERVFGGITAASAPPKSPNEGALDWRPSGLREYSAAVPAPVIWIGWSLPGVGDEPKGTSTFLEQFMRWAVQDGGYPRHHDISRIDPHYIPGVRASLLALEVSLKSGDAPNDAAQAAIIHTLGALSELTHVSFQTRRYNLASSVAYEQEGLVAHGLALARAAAYFQDPARVRQRAAELMALDESTLADYAAKYLTANRAHVVLVRPLSSTASLHQDGAVPAAGNAHAHHGEKLAAADLAHLGDWMKRADSGAYRTRTLANGLNVVVVPRVKAPFHAVLLGFHGGAGYGVRGAGIATLWSRQSYAAPYERGLQSRLFLDPDSLSRGLRGLGRDLSTTLSVLRDSITTFQVRWPPQAFVNQIERFEREEQTPDERLAHTSRQALLGTHPYAAIATVADMRKVSATDVVDWLNNVERPENAELVIVGDFDPDSAFRLVETTLGDWDGGHATAGSLPAPPALSEVAPGGSRLIVAHAPSASQTKVDVGCLLPPARANDWAVYDVFEQMLSSRLFDTLRTEIGASYSVSGSVEFLRGGTTLLHISADVDPLRMQAAFREVRAFVDNKADTSRFDDQSLEQARFFVGAHYNLGLDTSLKAAQRVLLAWRLDWPLDAVTRYPQRLLDVHRVQVQRIAEHCRANVVVSVVGDEPNVRAAWIAAGQPGPSRRPSRSPE
jgi:zinc protease